MPNINSYLAKIREAVFGEEVRGSIHDALSVMNNSIDASNQQNLRKSIITAEWSSSTSYKKDDYVWYPTFTNGILYRAKQDNSGKQPNTSTAYWESVQLIDEQYRNASDIVKVQNAQPTEKINKIWIKDSVEDIQVPTWDEFSANKDYGKSVGILGMAQEVHLTGASVQNEKIYFKDSLPAGTYRVSVINYTGRLFMNAIDANGTLISNRMEEWHEGRPNVITTTEEISGIAIYAVSAYIPTARTINVIFEHVGNYSDALYDFGVELEHVETFSLTTGSTLNVTRSFNISFPAGVYSVTLGDYNGTCLVSFKNGDTILNRWYMWNSGVKRYYYSKVPLTSIAIYLENSRVTGTLTLTINKVRLNETAYKLIDVEKHNAINPVDYNSVSGDGVPLSPYVSPDGTGGLYEAIKTILDGKGSGRIRLPVGCYNISTSINLYSHSFRITGDVWNYSAHPNGVYESNNGVKLKSIGRVPLISMSGGNGQSIEHIGFVGSVSNGYTVGLFDRQDPHKDIGIDLTTNYSDQFVFERLSFTGLGAAICASSTSSGKELDAFTFKNLNTDGCNIGVIFDNVGTYYSKITDCIIADTPAYGLFLGAAAMGVVISNNMFVRNSGKMNNTQKAQFTEGVYAVYIGDGRNIVFSNNQINKAGTFHNVSDPNNQYFEYDNCDALFINGVDCIIDGNAIVDASKYGIIVDGSRHTISGNTIRCNSGINVKADYSIISNNGITVPSGGSSVDINIEGDFNNVTGNFISHIIRVSGNYNTITRSGRESVVVESGATGNTLIGFDSSKITDNGTDTVIV